MQLLALVSVGFESFSQGSGHDDQSVKKCYNLLVLRSFQLVKSSAMSSF